MSLIEKLAITPLPELPQQADNLILWLGKHQKPGEPCVFEARKFQAILGVENDHGVMFVVEYLHEQGLLKWSTPRIGLSFTGWKHYTELTRGAKGSTRAFMAMKFRDEDLNKLVDVHFRPAVRATGFELFRLDDDPQAGLIDNRMRVEIRRARFLIADLSHENPGAYWEAGFAEGLDKPVIYTCREDKKTHFDTNHCQTVFWNPEKPEEAARKLKDTIRATLPAEARMEDLV